MILPVRGATSSASEYSLTPCIVALRTLRVNEINFKFIWNLFSAFDNSMRVKCLTLGINCMIYIINDIVNYFPAC